MSFGRFPVAGPAWAVPALPPASYKDGLLKTVLLEFVVVLLRLRLLPRDKGFL